MDSSSLKPRALSADLPKIEDGFRWVCVDFDGTLASRVWPDEGIGEPIKPIFDMVRHYAAQGYKVVVYTARSWNDHADIVSWLRKWNLWNDIDQVICGKPVAGLYIDDRAYNPWREDA